ncbi:hypothetical protein JB92DRAFT_2835848 [Gautieria morchelliformis]|nr:hypothetical protein JB92DRAFT_2835848 [Gautieria morchelliformis]
MTPFTPARATTGSARDDSPEEVVPNGQLSSDRAEQSPPPQRRPPPQQRHRSSTSTTITGSTVAWPAPTLTRPLCPFGTCTARCDSSLLPRRSRSHIQIPARRSPSASTRPSARPFLKRSSAALGVQKVQPCEQIQHLGERRDVDTDVQPDGEEGHDAAKGGKGQLTRRRPLRAGVEAGAEVGIGIGIGFELNLVQVRILYV